MIGIYGESGRAWLERLPEIVRRCAERWGLTVGEPAGEISFNLVLLVRRADGSEAILKAGLPGRGLRAEIAALRHWHGRGAALLLGADEAEGALLIERLRPGTPLHTLTDDEAATRIAARVMRQLWRPAPDAHAFPSVIDWGGGFGRHRARCGGSSGPLPPRLFDAAERTFAELAASMAPVVLLHGDLHHGNILAAERRPWLAIDPKGVIGEPAYETGAFLRNWRPDLLRTPSAGRLLRRRIGIFAEELGLDAERIRRWAFAQAMLSACWSVEDRTSSGAWGVACAELLADRASSARRS